MHFSHRHVRYNKKTFKFIQLSTLVKAIGICYVRHERNSLSSQPWAEMHFS